MVLRLVKQSSRLSPCHLRVTCQFSFLFSVLILVTRTMRSTHPSFTHWGPFPRLTSQGLVPPALRRLTATALWRDVAELLLVPYPDHLILDNHDNEHT